MRNIKQRPGASYHVLGILECLGIGREFQKSLEQMQAVGLSEGVFWEGGIQTMA